MAVAKMRFSSEISLFLVCACVRLKNEIKKRKQPKPAYFLLFEQHLANPYQFQMSEYFSNVYFMIVGRFAEFMNILRTNGRFAFSMRVGKPMWAC